MVTKLGPPCRVRLLKNGRDKLVAEKAGVGGSTPPLATIILKRFVTHLMTFQSCNRSR
jgi:hypothetical protein